MQRSSFAQEQSLLLGFESGKIYPQHEISPSQMGNNDWKYRASADFSEQLNHDGFPCLFGRKAWNGTSIRFLFCDLQTDATYEDFLSGLSSYASFVRQTPLVPLDPEDAAWCFCFNGVQVFVKPRRGPFHPAHEGEGK